MDTPGRKRHSEKLKEQEMTENDKFDSIIHDAVGKSLQTLGIEPKSPTLPNYETNDGTDIFDNIITPVFSINSNPITPNRDSSGANAVYVPRNDLPQAPPLPFLNSDWNTINHNPWIEPDHTYYPESPQTVIHQSEPRMDNISYQNINGHPGYGYDIANPGYPSYPPDFNNAWAGTPPPVPNNILHTTQYGAIPAWNQPPVYNAEISNHQTMDNLGNFSLGPSIMPGTNQNVAIPQAHIEQVQYEPHNPSEEHLVPSAQIPAGNRDRGTTFPGAVPTSRHSTASSSRDHMRMLVDGDGNVHGSQARCPLHNEPAGQFGTVNYWYCGCRRGLQMGKFSIKKCRSGP